MKINRSPDQQGSILLVAILTLTILSLIVAVSLSVATQNANTGTQTASWQSALCAAEAAADIGMDALNRSLLDRLVYGHRHGPQNAADRRQCRHRASGRRAI